ncbi:MAG: hypothetical protein IH987_00635 [Planctomycetes bacterium]|nr:hypothetical protein [Planctomycetota bacterium]
MSPNQRQTLGPAALFWAVWIAVCHTALVTASANKTAGRIAIPDLLNRIKLVIQAGEP